MTNSSAAAARVLIVGIGESLFDCYENREILGGAPLNAVAAAQQLAKCWPVRAVIVSRVGNDELGQRVRLELASRQISDLYVQTDHQRPTGRVQVTVANGEPTYQIEENTAWDYLEWNDHLQELAESCQGVIFGTLGQRSTGSRATIQRFVGEARSAIRMLDVNLRQHYYSKELLEASLKLANVIKLNQEELKTLAALFGWPADQPWLPLLTDYLMKAVILTHGERGTELILPSNRYCGPVPTLDKAPDADSVGAGDACAATCLLGLILNWPPETLVTEANKVAAYVASQPGATPEIPLGMLPTS